MAKTQALLCKQNKIDNFTFIKNLNYKIDGQYINIYNFTCMLNANDQELINYDIREGNKIPVFFTDRQFNNFNNRNNVPIRNFNKILNTIKR